MAFDANDLSPHEHFVMERTRLGEVADFTALAGPGGAKPVVRAGFLRKLLLRIDPAWLVHSPGVRLRGARIEGALDLTDCSGSGAMGLPALALLECEIPEPVDVSHSRLARLSLKGSRLTKLVAIEAQIDGELDLCEVAPLGPPGLETLTAMLRGVRIDGDLRARAAKFARAIDSAEDVIMLQSAEITGNLLLDDGFEAFGRIWVTSARVGGSFRCTNGQFLNRSDDAKGQAIKADGASFDFVRLGGKFKAEGEVSFISTRIALDIEISEASFRNEFGAALLLNNADIGGRIRGDGAKIAGQFLLQNCTIARNVELRGAEIVHRTTPRGDTFGRALDAANVKIGGGLLLHGANIKGEVFLAGAKVDGDVAFGHGRFINAGAWALCASNVSVGGNLTFEPPETNFAPHGQKTVIEGGATFSRARIDGAVSWSALEVRGPGPNNAKGGVLSFADASIAGVIHARGLITQQDALIDLSGAACGSLDDDIKAGWGVEGAKLDLDGFKYDRIDNAGERWRDRLAWLSRGVRFSSQSFTQAAHVYARAGKREDARRILLAQQDRRTRVASSGPVTWALSSLFGAIAGYGLAPIRVARALVLFLALGVVGVLTMNADGALVTPRGAQCNGAIEPALYAIDVALPVIDLGQESRCGPGRTARAELGAGVAVSETSDWRLFEGAAMWKWAHALYAIFGAILTALAVITFSGVLKPKD
ncbi:MAG: hypothetical protein K2P70_10860 [Hyphomonadaceae bacterium]|nr:hypothetical protein [Hyphomonadaceae bacterium]